MATTEITVVTDTSAPALDVFRDIKDRTLKTRDGLFVAEGVEVVRRLLRGGPRVHSLLTCPEKLERIRDCLRSDTPTFVADHSQIEKIVGYDMRRYGVLACAFRPAGTTLDRAVATACSAASQGAGPAPPIVVLENINDAENLGVIIRNAAAFGARLAILGGCCDPFYRRVVRVSMGAVFDLPLHISDDLPSDLESLRTRHGFTLTGAVVSDDATPLHRAERPARVALLFGAEGPGLSSAVQDLCDERVVIPMAPGCDSLNVAVASGVFLFHYRG